MTGRELDVPAWRGDWRARLDDRVRSLGFESVAVFLAAKPGVPYGDLVRLLAQNDDIAPVQLEHLHVELARTSEAAIKAGALDSMARFLRGALKRGWGYGKYWQSSVTGALAGWSAVWGGEPRLRKVKEALFALDPPDGWIPEAKDDALLLQAFDRGWGGSGQGEGAGDPRA